MAYTQTPSAGARLRASTLAAMFTEVRPIYARKTVDQSIISNAVLQNDTELFVPVSANASYEIECWLASIVTVGATSDLKVAWTIPAGATILDGGFGPEVGLPAAGSIGSAEFGAIPGAAKTYGLTTFNTNILLKGRLVIGATPGTLTLQWCQAVSTAVTTIMRAGSYVKITPTL